MSGVLQRAEVDCVILEAISPNKEWKFLEGSLESITRENLSFFLFLLFLFLSFIFGCIGSLLLRAGFL